MARSADHKEGDRFWSLPLRWVRQECQGALHRQVSLWREVLLRRTTGMLLRVPQAEARSKVE